MGSGHVRRTTRPAAHRAERAQPPSFGRAGVHSRTIDPPRATVGDVLDARGHAMSTDSKILAASAGLRARLGHYGLVAEVGRGGMTSVFLALLQKEDETTRAIALKQLRSEFSLQN